MAIDKFVVARNEDEALELARAGLGVESICQARNVMSTLMMMVSDTIPLTPSGDYAIYAVDLQVKRLEVGVGSA